ncbi:MAG: helix-turn-helix domain-containing protein [Chryseotalea sp. WA131a]|jgi:IS30 family transposase|nr:MAG: helix-turn-helix domain-containing protein [Chryseotalea sp. WA131a]
MTKYKQLVQKQRYVIGRLLKAGKTKEEMATAVGCHKSAISRELKRNVQTLVSVAVFILVSALNGQLLFP